MKVVKKIFLSATLSVISLFIVAFILEIWFHIFLPQPLDFHNLRKIIHIPKNEGGMLELIPHSESNYYGVENKINFFGLRDSEFSLEKKEGKIRIVFIGDSITYGIGVRLENSFPKIVEQMLNRNEGTDRYETINAGVIGYTLTDYLEFLKNKILKIDSDAIILGICLNDTADVIWRFAGKRNSVKEYFFIINRNLRAHSHFYFYLQERLRRLLYRYRIIKFNKPKVKNFLEGDFSEEDRYRIYHNLKEMRRLTLSEDIIFALVIFPFEMQLDEKRLNKYSRQLGVRFKPSVLDGAPQELIKRFAEELGIPVLDLFGSFKHHRDNGLFLDTPYVADWVHLNEDGHDLAAREIVDFLNELRI